ncbi:hypothetical protein EJ05DRAFT_472964 [Pseudovirgaria hyperparasitica]|uniref:SSD domain-containing protein n=1 Tax=Pseudovirgaria hyperparasitica TaxID=470096 RepID=A0A6A6WIW6_9PEZI|nr:uncharacterized protein EJ05DRAFT_472964 [Pseudovirgaria hyperparasitica]KAF2762030.1 hypothetical protein EJ05DRAFT_472964 [Pseudovirgaria hyperparasitica]
MIWYLLYPFRGTTEPPKLPTDHPLRRAFVSHGTRTSRHWLLSLLLSTAVGVSLCYPAFFLYGSSAHTPHSLPRHVWTSARQYEGNPETRADVEMRPIWIHGGYMQALEPAIFRDATIIQDIMIGQGFGEKLWHPVDDAASDAAVDPQTLSVSPYPCNLSSGTTNHQWGFHSPLMFANCTISRAETTEELINKLNNGLFSRSHWNITLRPSTVFAGKSFIRNRLVAADALVITLFDRLGFAIGDEWQSRAEALVRAHGHHWTFYPEGATVTQSQLYEFQFQPMSLNEDISISLAYFLTALYVIISLRKLRAVKSKLGLLFTVIVEMAVSILASLTICGLLGIQLSRIPREFHPFVVSVIGLENRFRLINAVIAYPPEMQTVSRIAHALGDVGPLALGSAGQMLVILWFISRVVYPDIAALCTFAAIALIFDFFFHLTFFTAVLSVDIRRMELQEFLDRANQSKKQDNHASTHRISWFEAMASGNMPFSTRIAGTSATVCFVLALNLHFFNSETGFQLLWDSLHLKRTYPQGTQAGNTMLPPPINQARTPSAWMEMQDYDTAKEIMHMVKPNAHKFIARVYEPLNILLQHADREHSKQKYPTLLEILRQLANKHFFSFGLVVVVVISLTTLLMNYLLWEEVAENQAHAGTGGDQLSVQTLPSPQSYDIARIYASSKADVISVSLDRSIAIWLSEPQTNSYSKATEIDTKTRQIIWPVALATFDEDSIVAVFCTDFGQLAFYSMRDKRLFKGNIASVDLRGHAPVSIFLMSLDLENPGSARVILVSSGGQLHDIDFRGGQVAVHCIHDKHATSASMVGNRKDGYVIVTTFHDGSVAGSRHSDGVWKTEVVPTIRPLNGMAVASSKLRSVIPLPELDMVATVGPSKVDLLRLPGLKIVYSFPLASCHRDSVRILHSASRQCQCSGTSVRSIAIVYTDSVHQNCVVESYSAKEVSAFICLGPSNGRLENCLGLERAQKGSMQVENPGVWETTSVQSILGVGKRTKFGESSMSTSSKREDSRAAPSQNGSLTTRLRLQNNSTLRNANKRLSTADLSNDNHEWRAWTLTMNGEFHTRSLASNALPSASLSTQEEELLVPRAGPIVRAGKRSVIVAVGNSLKVISTGNERFDGSPNGFEHPMSSVKGRKKGMKKNI